MRRYVVVGSGVAGVTAAQGIKRADPSAQVDVLSAEQYPYYQRPRLWQFLAGEIHVHHRPHDLHDFSNRSLRH